MKISDVQPAIRLHEEAGWVTRTLLFLSGVTLILATLVSVYHDWPLIMAGKLHPFGFSLICLIALPVGMLILIWSAIGEKRDWVFEDDQLRIRTMSLSAWQNTRYIELKDIAEVTHQYVSIGGEHIGHRHWIEITLVNRKRLRSPVVTNEAVVKIAAEYVGRVRSQVI